MVKKTNDKNKYSANEIEVLEGLEAVRKRPGMYIGSTGAQGLNHLLKEIIDNGVDELINGYGDTVEVTLFYDGSVQVVDNGRGIPVDINKTTGKTGLDLVFTSLHAGGKFHNENYKYSGGLHGVGSAVVNALSKWVIVEVYREGFAYRQEYHTYLDNNKLKIGVPKGELKKLGTTKLRGTLVKFLPDSAIFRDERFEFETISTKLRQTACLNQGIKLILIDERDNKNIQKEVFYYENGLVDYVKNINEGKSLLYNEPLFFKNELPLYEVSVALVHNDGYNDNINSFVNNIPTTEGGTHEQGFKNAYIKTMIELAKEHKLIKDKEPNLIPDDFREGLTAVISLKMQDAEFEGQTKTKLGNPDIKPLVENVVTIELLKIFDGKNKDKIKVLASIIDKAKSACKVRISTKKAKDLARQKNSINGVNLVGKLSSCTGKDYTKNELFIVEGDSAGGSAKQGRDRKFQAILPLKGKPLNAAKKRIDEVLANDEIKSIISALGAGVENDFDIKNIKYDKVVILADADDDGAHIRCLLLTFFFRYMRELILEGHVYIGMPPLYKIEKKGEIRYAFDDSELREMLAVSKGTIQRYKGLGEMNPDQLWDTTLNPATRLLKRVNIEDLAAVETKITVLMGDNVEARKKYIYKYANFNKVDNFEEFGKK